MKVSKNFDIREFVTPDIWSQFGDKSIWFVRPEVISLAQFYRDWFGKPITINNWHTGGSFKERGFRSPATGTGAALSQHKFGNAFDCDVEGLTAEEVRKEIIKNEQRFLFAGLRCLEADVTWVHSDCRNTGLDKILIVPKPK